MKNIILSTLLIVGFLFPTAYQASNQNVNKTEFIKHKNKGKKKSSGKKSSKKKSSKRNSNKVYMSDNNCTYNGHQLYVGSRGGCYYYTGNSKQYVDRSYCSGCR